MRKTMGTILIISGALLGGSTRTDLWNDSGMVMWFVVFCIACSMLGAGFSMWRGEN